MQATASSPCRSARPAYWTVLTTASMTLCSRSSPTRTAVTSTIYPKVSCCPGSIRRASRTAYSLGLCSSPRRAIPQRSRRGSPRQKFRWMPRCRSSWLSHAARPEHACPGPLCRHEWGNSGRRTMPNTAGWRYYRARKGMALKSRSCVSSLSSCRARRARDASPTTLPGAECVRASLRRRQRSSVWLRIEVTRAGRASMCSVRESHHGSRAAGPKRTKRAACIGGGMQRLKHLGWRGRPSATFGSGRASDRPGRRSI
jgi:hypothetical protein